MALRHLRFARIGARQRGRCGQVDWDPPTGRSPEWCDQLPSVRATTALRAAHPQPAAVGTALWVPRILAHGR